MLLRYLRLRRFRNLEHVELEPHPRFNVLSGLNGQGKTNLLEAIYLLSAVKSFRGNATNQALIGFEHDSAQLEARVERGGYDRLVRLEIGDRGKKVFLNNNPVRQLSDFFGTVNVVMFGPEDISLLKGGPSERRRFLDRAVFNAHPTFALEASQYDEILRQRNSLLKQPQIDPDLLEVYDNRLVEYGADVICRRQAFVEGFRPIMVETFAAIFDESFEADVRYEFKWADGVVDTSASYTEREAVVALLQAGLDALSTQERERGHTLVGPHRDDLVTTLNGRDVKGFASQGQHRAFVLAMKIAEISFLEERYRFTPILLLDDVSSELDRARNRFMFDFLRQRREGQVFITTTHRDYILLDEDVASWHVDGGQLQRDQGELVEEAEEEE